ncbi:MAG: DUF2802 domain-containing protein [Candidatus Accumulibacter sp.]|jgi:hypothetical protein|nr:DUF2802 domain-containing protein [Accumulibacter sp.]
MDFGFLAYLSWREILAVVIVLLVIYILFAFMRINRLRDRARSAQQSSLETTRGAIRSYAATQALEEDAEPDAEASTDAGGRAVRMEIPASVEKRTRNEPSPENPELRRIEILEQDIAQLRREIGGLRAEVQALREERQREVDNIQITQNASPFYSDAMQLATQGREAADISVLCGISRAEAELVVALVRRQASG